MLFLGKKEKKVKQKEKGDIEENPPKEEKESNYILLFYNEI